ncbi:camp independent regulatory protein, partial [Powellomyces hirtus]
MRTPAAVSGGPTYHGYIASTQDCLLLFEACRVGVLRRIQRRLSEQEREKAIRSGSVFVWEEGESGIKRWTDSKSWSPSRIKGSFLVYRELSIASTTSSVHVPLLTKKSISVRTKEGGKLHVVCYYTKSDVSSGRLQTPRDDPALQTLAIRAGLYPEILP